MSLLVFGLLVTTRIDEPSGDQLTGHAPAGESSSSLRGTDAVAGEVKRPDCSVLKAFNTTRWPSGEKISQFSSDASLVNCSRFPERVSYIQMLRVRSARSATATATREPSGEISRLP